MSPPKGQIRMPLPNCYDPNPIEIDSKLPDSIKPVGGAPTKPIKKKKAQLRCPICEASNPRSRFTNLQNKRRHMEEKHTYHEKSIRRPKPETQGGIKVVPPRGRPMKKRS